MTKCTLQAEEKTRGTSLKSTGITWPGNLWYLTLSLALLG